MFKKAVFLFIIFLTPFSIASADDISINGFIQGNYSTNLGRANNDDELRS